MILPDDADGKIRVEKKFGLGAFFTENEPLIDGGGVEKCQVRLWRSIIRPIVKLDIFYVYCANKYSKGNQFAVGVHFFTIFALSKK
jgi:hypothetical protein